MSPEQIVDRDIFPAEKQNPVFSGTNEKMKK
jgi:hypothetical protein